MNRYSHSPTKHSRERQSSSGGWRHLPSHVLGNEEHSTPTRAQEDPSHRFNAMMGTPKKVGQSNRWPRSLRMCRNNLYWYKSTSSPCICLGLDPASLRNYTAGLIMYMFMTIFLLFCISMFCC